MKILSYLLLFSFFLSNAQNEFIDTSFGENGGYTLFDQNSNNLWYLNLLDYNGDLYAAHFDFNDDGYIVKHDASGLVDDVFGNMGSLPLNDRGYLAWNANGHTNGLFTVTTDDNLLFVNGTYSSDFTSEFRVSATKLETNGTFDATYGSNGQHISTLPVGMDVIGTHQFEDDKIFMVGYNSITNGSNPNQEIIMTQLTANGQVDTNFGTNGLINLPYDVDNFWLISGIYRNNSVYLFFDELAGDGYVSKYDLDTMSFDTSFGNNGQLVINNFSQEEFIETGFIDGNGDIFVVGSVLTGSNLEFELFVTKYTNDVLDVNFGTNGLVNFQLIPNSNSKTNTHSLKQHGDKLLISGTSYNWDAENYEKAFFAQFNLDGSLDTDFGDNGIIINYLFDNLNVPFDYVYYADAIITAGSCPEGNDPQIPCLVKYLKQSNLSLEEAELKSISVYPNPVVDKLNFRTTMTIEKIEVFDLLGRTITDLSVNDNTVDLGDLETGQYFVKAYSSDQTFDLKILKN